VNKPRPTRMLADVAKSFLAESFAKQGFTATELVTRWRDIAGPEIAAHSEPLKIRWHRTPEGETEEPATLVLRVEGPAAIEIQHLSNVIIERVNRFFGWQAIGQIALRQAPLSQRKQTVRPKPNTAEAARIANTLNEIADVDLRLALGRLGAAIKQG